MDHVVAGGQGPGGRGGRRLPVAPRPAQPPRPAEDLVVGQHPERRQHEPAVERADGELRVRPAMALAQQFLEPLELALVVAEQQRRLAGAQHRAQPGDVAVDPLGRQEPHLEVHRLVAQQDPRKSRPAGAPALRRFVELVPRGHVLAHPPGDVEVVRRLGPGPLHLVGVRTLRLLHQERVRREQLQQRAPHHRGLAPGARSAGRTRHRQAPSPRRGPRASAGSSGRTRGARPAHRPTIRTAPATPCRIRRRPRSRPAR